jgi:hypothetical protein
MVLSLAHQPEICQNISRLHGFDENHGSSKMKVLSDPIHIVREDVEGAVVRD